MTRPMRRKALIVALASAALTALAVPSHGAKAPTLSAKLVNPEQKAAEKAATVTVTVTGVKLVDPAKSHEHAKAGEGHLHYKLDNGPIIATPANKLSFHELSSGSHTLVVMLAGNDHKPLGPQETLTVTVP